MTKWIEPGKNSFGKEVKLQKKYHLIKWDKVCRPKRKGGLGIQNLRKLNLSLLCKWWWRLESEKGMWQQIVEEKYVRGTCVSQLKSRTNCSPVWKDLLKVKNQYLAGRKMRIGNGEKTDFWRDAWCGQVTFRDKFKDLFEICNDQNLTVAEAAAKQWNLSYKRWMNEDLQNQLRKMRDVLMTVVLSPEQDKPVWQWGKNGNFTVKTMYEHLCRTQDGLPHKIIWKAKIPLKIKIFMWLVKQNAILTKDTLKRRNWKGDTNCVFCCEAETIEHLFFTCSMAKYVWSLIGLVIGADCRPENMEQYFVWVQHFLPTGGACYMAGLAAVIWAIWTMRNRVVFDKKQVRSPTEIVCSTCSFLRYWAGLLHGQHRDSLEAGAQTLQETALLFHPKKQAEGTMMLAKGQGADGVPS